MESLKKQRRVVNGSMTKLLTFVKGNMDNISLSDMSVRQERATKLLSEFQAIERDIFDLDSQVESDLSEFEDNYYCVVAKLNAIIRKKSLTEQPSGSQSDNTMNVSQHHSIEARLPKINIPIFDGNYMEWQSFVDIYTSTIDERGNLTGAQKFQYLKGLLKGEPAALIRHLPVMDASYIEAFQKLIQRYDRKRHTVNAFIKAYMEQQSISQPNASNIRKFADTLDESIRGLKALGPEAERRDPWLIYVALNKLDNETRSLWAQEMAENDFPTLDDLLKFLGRRIDMMESMKCYSKRGGPVHSITRAHAVATAPGMTCPICNQVGHRIFECSVYEAMTPKQKSETIQRGNRCFNCLNGNHRVRDCRSRARCQRCHAKHHTSIHRADEKRFENEQQPNTTAHMAGLSPAEEGNEPNIQSYNTVYTAAQGILPTAIIKIKDGSGQYQTYRALLDSASQTCFISEECMQGLRLKRTNARVMVKGLGEVGIGTTRGSTELVITAQDNSTTLTTQAFIVPKVSGVHNEFKLSEQDVQTLSGLILADPAFNKRGRIDVLLGVDIFFKVLLSEQHTLSSGLTAVRTIFGWVVAGRSEEQAHIRTAENFNILMDLDKSLRRFWKIEELPRSITRSPEEQKCEELFQTTTRQTANNKFVVKLPFKQPGTMLGTSYNAALNRLKAIERRFDRDGDFGKLYRAFMMEYEELGHMQRVEGKGKTNKYYFPHHGVLKASSTTTKLRVVFDASTKSSTGISLNDILLVGPTVQPPLINILLKFRQHEFVICGDVEKMYRQVWVSDEDQAYQNILWRNNANDQPSTYQLKTLTYRTASAAFLATRSLKEIGIKLQASQPEAAQAIQQDMYVDDLMTESNSRVQAETLITQIINARKNHGFSLRKLRTNNSEISAFIQGTSGDIMDIGEHSESPKVLGLQWDPCRDSFKFTTELPDRTAHTKRTLLSDTSRILDPLGWLAPIVIRMKILLQAVWMHDLSWDEELPRNLSEMWLKIKEDLHEIPAIRIPRWVQTSDEISFIGFSDASEYAYAAVIYAVVKTKDGLQSNIISAKSRVAPVKQISIPRLELMGALLLANLMKLVESALTIKITTIMLFTDSKIVLDWLSAHPRRWTTFVANRTSDIIQTYKRENWGHVGSKDNPADIASRGMNTIDLVKDNLWWHGPHWLIDAERTKTIHSTKFMDQGATTEELRPKKIQSYAVSTTSFFDEFINRYSSFHKMTKVLALTKRFITNCKKKQRSSDTNREEMISAELILIKHIQQTEFKVEIDALLDKKGLPRRTKLISLNPFLDDTGVLRVGGRIQKSIASYNVKHPIILPTSHNAVKCIVRDIHNLHNHPGVSLLTSITRRRFWIIRGKVVSRTIVHRCIKCIRQNPTMEKQLMANLPADRVQYSHPFYKVGVDYCGPFKVHPVRRRGQIPHKMYVCIFVCLSTKAVHIETVGNLTTESFLGAFSRFVSRRGNCHTVYSDNGTNFVGAYNQLRELFQFLKSKSSDIAAALLQHKIDWRFIPSGAPHMGGIWEAAVKQAKIQLTRLVGETILTMEEFGTLMTKIEAIMNSRPIAANESEDIDYITPAHFLIGRTFTDIADDSQTSNVSPSTRWGIVRHMQHHFWKRWHMDYLTILQKRNKWTSESKNLAAGDLVLLAESNLPSTCWALARVVETHPANDGKVRIVSIRVANTEKIIQRPIHKLCKLPVLTYNVQMIHGRRNVEAEYLFQYSPNNANYHTNPKQTQH